MKASLLLTIILYAIPGKALIRGGKIVPQGKWPAIVELTHGTGTHLCTGTLIREDIVLTAAHCFFWDPNVKPESYRVHIGSGIRSLSKKKLRFEKIEKIVFSERLVSRNIYKDGRFQIVDEKLEDIAAIVLKKPISDIKPIGFISTDQLASYLQRNRDITLIGLGHTLEKDSSGIKRIVSTKVQASLLNNILIGEKDKGAYKGDSGGPAIVKVKCKNGVENKYLFSTVMGEGGMPDGYLVGSHQPLTKELITWLNHLLQAEGVKPLQEEKCL